MSVKQNGEESKCPSFIVKITNKHKDVFESLQDARINISNSVSMLLKEKNACLQLSISNVDNNEKCVENEDECDETETSMFEDDETPQFDLSTFVVKVGQPAPPFKGTAVVNGEYKEIALSDYAGKYVVFFFYPLDFSYICPTEIIGFSDCVETFNEINTVIVGCSVDSHFTHLAWINTPRNEGGLGNISFPLLSDITNKICKDYEVYIPEKGHSFRALYIIDDKGILRQIMINDLSVGRSIDETLRLVKAIQFSDNNEGVCPVNWMPGDEPIIKTPEKKKEYFENNYE